MFHVKPARKGTAIPEDRQGHRYTRPGRADRYLVIQELAPNVHS